MCLWSAEPPLTGPRSPSLAGDHPPLGAALGLGEGGCLPRAHLLAPGPAEPEGDGPETDERWELSLECVVLCRALGPQPPLSVLGSGNPLSQLQARRVEEPETGSYKLGEES